MSLMSKRAYARAHNVDEKTVRKAIASGKIPMVGGMIDSDIADACWARNRDGGQHSKLAESALVQPAVHAEAKPAVDLPETPAPASPQQPAFELGPPPEPPAAAFELAPLTVARIANTQESTLLKEIARRRLEGGLLEAEEVDRTWGQLLQVLKDRMRMIPDNVGELLAASADPAECRSILMREILGALATVSKGVEGMAA